MISQVGSRAGWRDLKDFQLWQEPLLDKDLREKLKREKLGFVDHKDFHKPETRRIIEKKLEAFLAEDVPPLVSEEVWDGLSQKELQRRSATLASVREPGVFLLYNYCRYRLCQSSGLRANGESSDPKEVGLAMQWFRKVLWLRRCLMNAHAGLALSCAGRVKINGFSYPELAAEGLFAVARSIEHFNVERGVRFATYATRSIQCAFCRLMRYAERDRRRYPVSFDPGMEKSDETERRSEEQREEMLERLAKILNRNIAGLTELERRILAIKFGLGRDQAPNLVPRWKIAKETGLDFNKIRALEEVALKKLREAWKYMDVL